MRRFLSADMILKAVFLGLLYSGLGTFISVCLLHFVQGYFLYGLLIALAASIVALGVNGIIGLITGTVLSFLSYLFFPYPVVGERFYKFSMGFAAILSAGFVAYQSWERVLFSISATGDISEDFVLFLTVVSILIFVYISQKLAKVYLEKTDEKIKLEG